MVARVKGPIDHVNTGNNTLVIVEFMGVKGSKKCKFWALNWYRCDICTRWSSQ